MPSGPCGPLLILCLSLYSNSRNSPAISTRGLRARAVQAAARSHCNRGETTQLHPTACHHKTGGHLASCRPAGLVEKTVWEKSPSCLCHCEKRSHPEVLGHKHTDLLIGLVHHYQKLSSCSYGQHTPRRASSHRTKVEAFLKPSFLIRARFLSASIGRFAGTGCGQCSWLFPHCCLSASVQHAPDPVNKQFSKPRHCAVQKEGLHPQPCQLPRQPPSCQTSRRWQLP